MADPFEIDLWRGEIAELEVDAIIIPSNESLFMTNAVGRSVKLRGGEAVERAAVDQGPVPSGTAIVTGGGALPALHVIHAVGIGHDLQPNEATLRSAYHAAFDIAARMGLRRLAVAPLGVDRGVFGAEEAAASLVAVIGERQVGAAWVPDSLVVVASGQAELAAFRAALGALRSGLA